jgi:hypothetical protein
MKHIMWALILGLMLAALAWPGDVLAQTSGGQAYVVQHSDTLWKLAEKYLGDGRLFDQIIAATAAQAQTDASFSPITDPDRIHPGQKIRIPAADEISSVPTAAPAPPEQSAAAPAGHIAFSFWNNGPGRCTYEINIISVEACLQSAAACQANRRIFPLNNASEPALSPDGQRLAFRGWGAIPDELKPGQEHPYKDCAAPQAGRWLHIVGPDAVNPTGVTGYFEDSHPDWSPDGQRILFDSGRIGDGLTRLLFLYADGSGEEELQIAGQQPSWAADNERLVYRGCDQTGNRCGLWLARATPLKPWEAGANMVGPLLEEPAAAHPDWSPLSEQIVYQSNAAGSWDLYLINADGTGRRQLTTGPAVEGLPAWEPNGQWVAYLSNEGGNWGIWLIPAGGGPTRQLFAFDGGQFSPQALEPYGVRDWLDEQISWGP